MVHLEKNARRIIGAVSAIIDNGELIQRRVVQSKRQPRLALEPAVNFRTVTRIRKIP